MRFVTFRFEFYLKFFILEDCGCRRSRQGRCSAGANESGGRGTGKGAHPKRTVRKREMRECCMIDMLFVSIKADKTMTSPVCLSVMEPSRVDDDDGQSHC